MTYEQTKAEVVALLEAIGEEPTSATRQRRLLRRLGLDLAVPLSADGWNEVTARIPRVLAEALS